MPSRAESSQAVLGWAGLGWSWARHGKESLQRLPRRQYRDNGETAGTDRVSRKRKPPGEPAERPVSWSSSSGRPALPETGFSAGCREPFSAGRLIGHGGKVARWWRDNSSLNCQLEIAIVSPEIGRDMIGWDGRRVKIRDDRS